MRRNKLQIRMLVGCLVAAAVDAGLAEERWFANGAKLAPRVKELVGWGSENDVVHTHLLFAWLTKGKGLPGPVEGGPRRQDDEQWRRANLPVGGRDASCDKDRGENVFRPTR